MGRTITMYDLLLSCPGDAYNECYPAVKNAIDEFNKEAQRNFSIGVSLKHWSTDSYPQSGDKAQELLNSQIVDCADVAIAIFWTRFGTPTDKYGSGTEEEIDRFMKSNKQLFLYFLDKPVQPSMTDSQDYIENRKKIAGLKEKYNGIYSVVKNEVELRKKIIDHLKMHFFKSNPLRKDYDSFYTVKDQFEVKFMENSLMAVYDEQGCARTSITIRNLTKKPIVLNYGLLAIISKDGELLSKHRVYGFGNKIIGADFQLTLSPMEEMLGDLYVGFESSDCLRLGVDEYGNTQEKFIFELELTDTYNNKYHCRIDEGLVVVKGNFLWKVHLKANKEKQRLVCILEKLNFP